MIHARLETFEIADCPPYMALSYEWKEPNSEEDPFIQLHGRPFTVRNNLLRALCTILEHQRRQEKHPDAYVWVDALCIDQRSIGERNHQVRLMREIYTRASLVVSWLGFG
ncbi:heterokaryon incompatibility, partial [Polyplosphaeria fusca]